MDTNILFKLKFLYKMMMTQLIYTEKKYFANG